MLHTNIRRNSINSGCLAILYIYKIQKIAIIERWRPTAASCIYRGPEKPETQGFGANKCGQENTGNNG